MPSLSVTKILTLKKFVAYLKTRLEKIEMRSYQEQWCGKLLTGLCYGKRKTWRCYGDTSNGRCYNCEYTGFDCAGGCGNDVIKPGTFCSSSCKGMYYNF